MPRPNVYLLALSIVACATARVGAQLIPTPPTQDSSANPVVTDNVEVVLRDGSSAEGQLIELVPNDHVVIRLPSGEERRYPWAFVTSVRHTEPAPVEAAAPPPEAPPEAPVFDALGRKLPSDTQASRVRFVTEAGVVVEVRVGTEFAGYAASPSTTYVPASSTGQFVSSGPAMPVYVPVYQTLCRGSCDARLAVGQYGLNVRVPPGYDRSAFRSPRDRKLVIDGSDLEVRLHYQNRRNQRIRRWIGVTLGTVVLGCGLMIAGSFDAEGGSKKIMAWTGVGLASSFTFLFAFPLATRDRLHMDVRRIAGTTAR